MTTPVQTSANRPQPSLYTPDLERCVKCHTVGATAGPARDRMVPTPHGWICRRQDWCARQAAARERGQRS